MKICPDCGAEIGRSRWYSEETGRLYFIPLPRTCPACDAPLIQDKHRTVVKSQRVLTGEGCVG